MSSAVGRRALFAGCGMSSAGCGMFTAVGCMSTRMVSCGTSRDGTFCHESLRNRPFSCVTFRDG